jgi:hypothetical protein
VAQIPVWRSKIRASEFRQIADISLIRDALGKIGENDSSQTLALPVKSSVTVVAGANRQYPRMDGFSALFAEDLA